MILIAGPCVIESRDFTFSVARSLREQLSILNLGPGIDFYFKASFDKANRSSGKSFRGPGILEGLKILAEIRNELGLKILTDFHYPEQAMAVAEICDVLQVPAFLCRQSDMIEAGSAACSKYNRVLNVKKGQFLAPWDARHIVEKVKISGGPKLWLTERGTSFGYNELVVDMSAIQSMQKLGVPVIYDATHSIQTPGSGSSSTGGRRQNIEVLARAAVAAGADGVFLECHPEPSKALSDGPNSFFLPRVGDFVRQLQSIQQLIHSMPRTLPTEDRIP